LLSFLSLFSKGHIQSGVHYLVKCQQVHYKIILDYIHNFFFQEIGNEYFILQYKYSAFLIEESAESYDYDFGSFLAATGGNIAMFLGFSCFSILLLAIDWIEKFLPVFTNVLN
jgi:hypothetical protein